ncbi:hypothetical protein MHU86_867 [Fragilaria crotonensis]|nr:hypothetical protein MHU86_867 [Fragilaria crotonensis]
MANTNTNENEGIHRPVAAVSSTSSLDSFTASAPQHSSQNFTSIPSQVTRQLQSSSSSTTRVDGTSDPTRHADNSNQNVASIPSSVSQHLRSSPSSTTQIVGTSNTTVVADNIAENVLTVPHTVEDQLQSSQSPATRVDGTFASPVDNLTQNWTSTASSVTQLLHSSPPIASGIDCVSDCIGRVPNPLSLQNPVESEMAISHAATLVPSKTSSTADVTPASDAAPASSGVAEFLYQLSKMLTDDNREVIEWSNSRIEVHNPHRLANEVLHKYFRHSKFASFQRQLNYFGFRKLAGKGKMAPCSYVNDAASPELRSLLLIKRKTTPTTAREKGSKKRERAESAGDSSVAATPQVNPVLADILQRSTSDPVVKSSNVPKIVTGKGITHQVGGLLKSPVGIGVPANNSHIALARSAVGRGIRHGYASIAGKSLAAPPKKENTTTVSTISSATPDFTFKDPHQLGMDVQTSLSELSNNFKNSLRNAPDDMQCYQMLSRDSSLVDLAMLDPIEPTPVSEMQGTGDPHFLSFVDFPNSSQDFDLPNLGG